MWPISQSKLNSCIKDIVAKKLLTILAKRFILNVRQGSEYAPGTNDPKNAIDYFFWKMTFLLLSDQNFCWNQHKDGVILHRSWIPHNTRFLWQIVYLQVLHSVETSYNLAPNKTNFERNFPQQK